MVSINEDKHPLKKVLYIKLGIWHAFGPRKAMVTLKFGTFVVNCGFMTSLPPEMAKIDPKFA